MALGGGTWTTQNKELPGYYTNFSSIAKASAALSDRGIAAVPLVLNWGPTDEIITVTAADLQKNSMALFGYAYTAPELLPLREIFKHAVKLHTYRLATDTVKASNAFAEARYGGTRGNDLTVKIEANVDAPEAFDVSLYLGGAKVDAQTVAKAAELMDNDFVVYKKTAELIATAGSPLTGGANGSVGSGEAHQAFLDKAEGLSFHAMGCPSADKTTVALYVAFTRRMLEEVGANFQLVAYRPEADYEGVIGLENEVKTYPLGVPDPGAFAAIYWLTGAQAGCGVNKSLLNAKYDGELGIETDYRQDELKTGLKAGKFMFHNVDGAVRVLDDINTLVTLSDTKGAVFQSNQTMRVVNQIDNDVASLFKTRYLGVVPNDADGRIGLWNDVCKLLQALVTLRALENFDTKAVSVAPGETKKAVLLTLEGLYVVNVMGQLYLSARIA